MQYNWIVITPFLPNIPVFLIFNIHLFFGQREPAWSEPVAAAGHANDELVSIEAKVEKHRRGQQGQMQKK